MGPLEAILIWIFLAQNSTSEKKDPKFTDYPVEEIYRGNPVPPNIITAKSRRYRTMIRDGASGKVQFSGHYTIAEWGCGTDCMEFAIVDSISGMVYDEFWISGFPADWWNDHPSDQDADRLKFVPDSRLLKIKGCPNDHDCGFYDYEMVDGQGLRTVRKRLLPKRYQL